MAEGLRTLISGLYDKHLAADGRGVDYASLAHDVGFRDYITASAELTKVWSCGARCFVAPAAPAQQAWTWFSRIASSFLDVHACQVDLIYLDRRELTAFFINIYNALVIHGMVLFGPADSTLKRCVTVPSADTTAASATMWTAAVWRHL